MGAELLFKILRASLVGVVVVLLILVLAQRNSIERRLIEVGSKVDESGRRQEQKFAELLEEVRRRPAGSASSAPTGESDPRTLPYWRTDDNILADLDKEPRPPPDAPKGGVLRYYTTSNPRSLNTLVYNEAELQERICAPVYEYLAEQSRENPDRWIPGIANRITANKDYTEFTCYLRKGMLWHKPFLAPEESSGTLAWLAAMPRQPVTAHDVKFTFDVVRDPLSECSSLASYLEDLDRVEVVDDYTLRVTWRKSRYYNLSSTLGLVFVYPKFIYERDEKGAVMPWERIAQTFPQHWFNLRMCGTGPFQFDGFEPNQYIRLRRNDDWWGPHKPVLDAIHLNIQQDYEILLAMFKKGEIDLFAPLPIQYRAEVLEKGDVAKMIERGEVKQKLWEMFTYYYVGWNMRRPVLKEREVRRALAHLFPKERIIRDVYFGLAVPQDGPVHPWESYYVRDLEKFEFDPAKAAALLDAAGWKLNARGIREKFVDGENREMRIRALHPTQGNIGRDIVQLFQKSAQEAGVLIEPVAREWSVMTKMLEDKDFDACVLGWGNTWDGDPVQIWHSRSAETAKGSNHVSYKSPEVDSIIDRLQTEFDPAKRKELWGSFQRTIVADQPYCFNLVRTRVWWIRARCGNPYLAKLRPQDWFLPWYVKD